ncbi:transcription/translation regulatory transformer protein RfaH [Vibrio navarrensis]|uniref:transcription/translation regulatory transformer protein RfaH n=1 Tax=Vibrio navarrensis TaxID=29495 RepID=UPI00051D953E|nr:transcription/translation regulatory transformer protein RfaH [Vibrio navarrensis]KGK13007.1 transcriptional regulator [Vibrio navarrensis]KGK13662.1 transcriptional regulator [Vibrio navarrensis]
MKRWYLLYCKRGEQLRAKQHLENQGVECFYPTIVVEKILRGKRQKKSEPLFPSYIFVRFDFELGPTFTTVRSTRGVVDFVRFGAQPKELQGDLIFELKEHQKGNDICVEAKSLPRPGASIRVKKGQFAGIDAIFQEQDGETRSIMLVKMISQVVPVSISNSDLELGC